MSDSVICPQTAVVLGHKKRFGGISVLAGQSGALAIIVNSDGKNKAQVDSITASVMTVDGRSSQIKQRLIVFQGQGETSDIISINPPTTPDNAQDVMFDLVTACNVPITPNFLTPIQGAFGSRVVIIYAATNCGSDSNLIISLSAYGCILTGGA